LVFVSVVPVALVCLAQKELDKIANQLSNIRAYEVSFGLFVPVVPVALVCLAQNELDKIANQLSNIRAYEVSFGTNCSCCSCGSGLLS